MDKELIKNIIVENQSIIQSIKFVRRDCKFDDNLNYVLVGIRRAGKSYLLYQHIHDLLEKGHSINEILYFNFEDDRITEMTVGDLHLILDCYSEMYEHKPFIFLDEVQIVDKWEKFARRLADQKYRVFITGSNAKMFSGEISTTLGGRYMVHEVFPYSFAEFLSVKGLKPLNKNFIYSHKSQIVRLFDEYFHFGGIPESVSAQDKRQWISNLYNKIFFGDLLSRYQIRNDYAMRVLVRKLTENLKQPTSYNRLANIVSSAGKRVSTDAIIDYIKYMNESWLILPFENYAGKMQDKVTNRKYYFTDNGVLNLFLIDPNTSLLENLVAINMFKKFGEGAYFYNSNVEIDFYVPDEKLAVQVSYSLNDEETRNWEIGALIKASKVLEINEMIIVTKDEEETIEQDNFTIKVVPIWKWLLTT